MLYLSILANTYISGLAGVFFSKLPYSKNKYQYIYPIISIIIIAATLIVLRSFNAPLHAFPGTKVIIAIATTLAALLAQTIFEFTTILLITKKAKLRLVFQKTDRILSLIVGLLEELSYRLIILSALQLLGFNDTLAVCVSAVLYCFNHLYIISQNKNKLFTGLGKLFLGLILGEVFLISGIIGSIVVHLTYNIIALFILPSLANKPHVTRLIKMEEM